MSAIANTADPPLPDPAPAARPGPSHRSGPAPSSPGHQRLPPGPRRPGSLQRPAGRTRPPPATADLDQLATAARQLPWPEDVNEVPGCISQRVARLETVAAMVADPHWEVANEPRACAWRVLDYAHDAHPLIPHGLPRFGRLDEAIVVEAAWLPLFGKNTKSPKYKACRV